MLRFTAYALPLLILLLAVFGFMVEVLDLEPAGGGAIRLAILEASRVPAAFVLLAWLMEACGLMALFLVTQGRAGSWWLDGLLSGWLAWVFRGPLLVLTITVATHQPQEAWWRMVFGWWILYSICGIALALLARGLGETVADEVETEETVAAALALAAPAIAAAALAESHETSAVPGEAARGAIGGTSSGPYPALAPDLFEEEPGEPSGSGVIDAERPLGAT